MKRRLLAPFSCCLRRKSVSSDAGHSHCQLTSQDWEWEPALPANHVNVRGEEEKVHLACLLLKRQYPDSSSKPANLFCTNPLPGRRYSQINHQQVHGLDQLLYCSSASSHQPSVLWKVTMLYSALFLCTTTPETLTYCAARQHENKNTSCHWKERHPPSLSLEKMQAMGRTGTLMLSLHFFNADFFLYKSHSQNAPSTVCVQAQTFLHLPASSVQFKLKALEKLHK